MARSESRGPGPGDGAYSFVAPVRKTVLVVDDDADFVEPLRTLLRKRGHRVLVAARGSEASDVAGKRRPDAIVIDGLLPDIDGITWLSSLRRGDGASMVVFVSAFSGFVDSVRRLERELGVSLVLQKPIDFDSLCGAIERHRATSTIPPPVQAAAPIGTVAALSVLRTQYARALPDKLEALGAAVRSAEREPSERALVAEARSRAHKLSGTAGSYGFPLVSEGAAVIDEALGRVLESEAPPGAEVFAVVREGLARAIAGAEPQPREVPARRAMPLGVGGARLLAVGLEPPALRLLEDVGQAQLLEIVRARGASDAVELGRERSFDAVLVGLSPFGDDAARLVHALHEDAGRTELPVAFVRTEAPIEERAAAARLGASLFLEAATNADALGLAVRQLLAMPGTERPRVLVAVSDPAFSRSVAAALERGGLEPKELDDTRLILDSLEQVRPSVLVLDPATTPVGGTDVCSLLRNDVRWQDVPRIVLTAGTGLEPRLAALRAGADDVIVDPVSEEELVLRARTLARRSRLLSERFDKDLLTGLPLRRPFLELLARSMAESRRHGRPLTVALLDLDFFKGINDRCGHGAGDRALAAMGKLLTARFRLEDLRGRWGGEEFALAFPGETAAVMHPSLVQLLAELAAIPFGGAGRDEAAFRVTFSAGLASYPADGATTEALLEVADRRLYEAKRLGRARVIGEG